MNRRDFLRNSLAASLAAGAASAQSDRSQPWYRRTWRWGQTNITEKDPARYDIAFWRQYWKTTEVQGVIINAGGIVAYYPSKFPLHHRAEFLNGRDLFGELTAAAHEDGLVVLARMDSNRTLEDFYRAHPDWFARTASGEPYRADERYVTCVNSAYYDEYLPGVLREIVERSHPEGFTDNSWSGLGRDSICYCSNCERKFRAAAGKPVPKRHDWDDPVYRQWIQWNYARRLEIWDLNNRATKAAGGPDCIWVGMNSGSVRSQAGRFRDNLGIAKRAEMLLLDHQSRTDSTGFQQNGDTGKLMHGILGWDKVMPESMAMYQAGRTSFRLAAKPAPEARMWMIEGFAGGIQPWWHHVGAYHEDRRAYRTAAPVMRWFRQNEQYLVNRRPVATVGVLWSQENIDYFGRDRAEELVDQPYHGFMQALIRARIPYLPIHADLLERDGANLKLVILPNLGAMSDEQCAAVRRFVERGGGLLATGVSSLHTPTGAPRPDFALADLFGAHTTGGERPVPRAEGERPRRRGDTGGGSSHTYLRIASGERHVVLRGFEETEILPYGGTLDNLRADAGAIVPLTYIPQSPVYPPETAWMRTERTNIPALVLNTRPNGARVAFLPADLDRRYTRDNLPDHANLLANIVRWAAADDIPLAVEGRGLIDCHLYEQPSRAILHLVNLTNAGTWRAPIEELFPIGPVKVRLKLPPGIGGRSVKFLVAGRSTAARSQQGWLSFLVNSIEDHEVVAIA